MQAEFEKQTVFGDRFFTVVDEADTHEVILDSSCLKLARCSCDEWRPPRRLCAHVLSALQAELNRLIAAAAEASLAVDQAKARG